MTDSPISDLAAALNGHQITDDEGQIAEETAHEESAPVEQTTEEESTPPEKALSTDSEAPKADDQDTEDQPVEDESGKRYVPQKRFDQVYAKAKQTERELQEIKAKLAQGDALLQQNTKSKAKSSETVSTPTKADVLELRMTMPQFDPKPDEEGKPTNPDYSPELDSLGYEIWKANPGITPLQAAQKAIRLAKSLAGKESEIRQEARAVKTIQSDQGITNRVVSRQDSKPDYDKMSDKELEAYLKSTGQW